MVESTPQAVDAENPADGASAAILKWAAEQPLWKQQALRIALAGGDIGPASDAVYSLVVAEGTDPEKNAKIQPLTHADLGSSGVSASKFVLKSVKGVKNVNRLANDQDLNFGKSGLTCIYGDNGSGKSGYTRIFKLACSARDQEVILPDVFSDVSASVPSADFVFESGGQDEVIEWVRGSDPEARLSRVAVFDSLCAPFYVEKSDKLNFVPYRLACFEHLSKLLDQAAAKINLQLSQYDIELGAPLIADVDAEEVDKKLTVLRAISKDLLDERLTWTEQDEANHLAAHHAALSPTARATALVKSSEEIDGLVEALKSASKKVDDAAVQELRSNMKALEKLTTASMMAASDMFDGEPLTGVGSDEWLLLYKSARSYSEHVAYPGRDFPPHDEGDHCVLCQQELDLGARSRLVRFEEFVSGDLAKQAAKTRDKINGVAQDLVDTTTKLGALSPSKDLAGACPSEAIDVAKARDAILKRLAAVNALTKDVATPIDSVEVLDFDDLSARSMKAWHAGNDLSKVIAAGNEEELVARAKGFAARRALSFAKDATKARLDIMQKRDDLVGAKGLCNTTGVTKIGGDLIRRYVTEQLSNRFNEERKALDVTALGVVLSAASEKGAVKRSVALKEQKVKALARHVLSEGEYRAVALAAFLAEASTTPGGHPILVDDPVSSLDHRRREKVAKRLVKEAKTRQVIVFTHDIAFYLAMQGECSAKGVDWASVYLERGSGGFGSVSGELAPWAAQKFAQRKHQLLNRLSTIKKHQADVGEDEAYREKITVFYDRARKTWERALEELVFVESIVRYRSSVETKRLVRSPIDDEVYDAIEAGMTMSSKITGHDQAENLGGGWPTVDDADEIMSGLVKFEQLLKAKSEAVEKARKAKVGPQTV